MQSLDPLCAIPISLFGVDVVSFIRVNSNLLLGYLEAKPDNEKCTISKSYIEFQRMRELRFNTDAATKLDNCKRAFKEQTKNKELKKQNIEKYREEKDRTILQREEELMSEELWVFFRIQRKMNICLKSDEQNFTKDRWFEVFLQRNQVPENQREALCKRIFKPSSDREIIDEYINQANRTNFGIFAEDSIKYLENETNGILERYGITNASGIHFRSHEKIIKRMELKEHKILLLQSFTDVYVFTQYFINTGFGSLDKFLNNSNEQTKKPLQIKAQNPYDQEVQKLFHEVEKFSKVEVQAKMKMLLPLPASATPFISIINSMLPPLFECIKKMHIRLDNFIFLLEIRLKKEFNYHSNPNLLEMMHQPTASKVLEISKSSPIGRTTSVSSVRSVAEMQTPRSPHRHTGPTTDEPERLKSYIKIFRKTQSLFGEVVEMLPGEKKLETRVQKESPSFIKRLLTGQKLV